MHNPKFLTAALALVALSAIGGAHPFERAAPFVVAQVSMTPPAPNVTPKAMETIGAAQETPIATPASITPRY